MQPQLSLKYWTLADGTNLAMTPIQSLHGKKTLYCKICQEFVQVAYHVQGKQRTKDDVIFWDFVVDAKEHTLRDDSH